MAWLLLFVCSQSSTTNSEEKTFLKSEYYEKTIMETLSTLNESISIM